MLQKSIVLTNKDSSTVLLIHLCELALRSALGDIEHRSKFSDKWREVNNELQPYLIGINETVEYLQERWLASPSLKENDMVRDIYVLQGIVNILINIGEPEVDKALRDIVVLIDNVRKKKKGK